jgi:hypothetical protein
LGEFGHDEGAVTQTCGNANRKDLRLLRRFAELTKAVSAILMPAGYRARCKGVSLRGLWGDVMSFRSFAAIAAAGLAFGLAGPGHAASAQSAGATAQVLEEIQFAVLLDMNFGRIAVRNPATGGTVVIDPNSSSRTCDPSLVCSGTWGVSRLELSGSDANVQVNYDPTFQLTGPGAPIVAEPIFPGGPGTVVHLTGGYTVVNFGARIYINPGQAPGNYSGDFSVYLEYN